MATRTRKSASSDETSPNTGFSLANLTPTPSTGVKRASKARIEPDQDMIDALLSTLDNGPLAYPSLPDEATAKTVVNALVLCQSRLASQGTVIGLKKSVSQADDGTWVVDFQAAREKKEYKGTRRYTSAQIREWAAPMYGEIKGRIPDSIRDEFKKANGF